MAKSLDDSSVPPDNLLLEEVYQRWIEDSQAFATQKERIEKLMEDNHCLMCTISELKEDLKASKAEFDSMSKFVRILNSSMANLKKILSFGKQVSDKRVQLS